MHERYRLTRLFAQGGMAEVYAGMASGAEGFEKPVAIKRILPHLAKDEQIARMFLSEAKLATFLSHQNIVQVFDVGRGPDGLFIVMELVNGWDLGVVIDRAAKKETTFPPALAAFVASQALAGLCHAYKQTHEGKPIIIAHRDVSASNILISSEGEVKVADFGIARVQASSNRTEPGTFKGKIAYAAPEVLQGQPASKASDQFGLGIVLHEMLTGNHPFGHFDNSMAYADAIVNRPPAGLPGAPPLLAEIVARALCKLPQDRFESPEALARSLAQFLASSGTPSTTQELSDLLRGLEMPPLPSDLTGQDTVIRARLPGSFSLQSLPSLEGARPISAAETEPSHPWQAEEMAALQEDWVPQGPQLDTSGELHGKAAAQEAPRPSPSPTLPADGVRPLAEVIDVELARDLKVDRLRKEAASAEREMAAIDSAPQFRRRGTGAARWFKWMVLAALVAAGAIKGQDLYPDLNSLLSERLRAMMRSNTNFWPANGSRPTPVLRIDSEPSGARIQIGSELLGETPLFIENLYPKAQIEVKLSLKGYQPWTGKFAGGEPAELKATLRRR